MKRRTTQILAELKQLARDAEANLYRRIGLAAEALSDVDWLAASFGGCVDDACKALQDDYFRDLGGYVSLGKLLQMRRDVPEADWRSVGYDVAAVQVMHDDREIPGGEDRKKPEKTAWKKMAADRLEEIESLKAQLKQQSARISELEAAVEAERVRSAKLEGQIEELRRHDRRAA
jgi:hypothetical protein